VSRSDAGTTGDVGLTISGVFCGTVLRSVGQLLIAVEPFGLRSRTGSRRLRWFTPTLARFDRLETAARMGSPFDDISGSRSKRVGVGPTGAAAYLRWTVP
jgi:hypothetical protein